MPVPRHALLLTAGLGTRLMPLTAVRAKPAVPVAGQPLVCRIVAKVAAAGFHDIVCNLHHLPQSLTRVLGDGADLAARVRYSWEGRNVLGSAGGPRLAFDLIDEDTLLVVNGDTLTDADLPHVTRVHSESNALVTMALVPNTDYLRYGGVILGKAGDVTGFVPRGPGARGSFHFIGVQVVERRALQALTTGVPANSIGGVYEALLAAHPGAIRGVVVDASFWDVGTVADYYRTTVAWSNGADDADWPLGARSTVHPAARCVRSVVWDDVHVDAGAELVGCIVTDGVRVPGGSRYRQMVLTPGPDPGVVVATPFELTD